MPTWKCKYFAKIDEAVFYWNPYVENCGLCINWCDGECIHQDKLKVQGENEGFEEGFIDNDFSRNVPQLDDGGEYGN